MKKILAACAIVALIFAIGCPQKKAEEKPKPAAPETTMQAPPPETGAVKAPAETVKAPAETAKAPAPTPTPKPKPKSGGKPPKIGR